MALKRTEYIGRFMATDEHGGSHALHVLANIRDVPASDDPHAEQPGLESIHTEDGRVVVVAFRGTEPVNLINWLTDIAAGVRLTSDDEDAP